VSTLVGFQRKRDLVSVKCGSTEELQRSIKKEREFTIFLKSSVSSPHNIGLFNHTIFKQI
jgi:hypothetical protein